MVFVFSIAFFGAVQESFIAVVRSPTRFAITTGGPNLTIEVAEGKLTADSNGKQTSKNCEGEKRDLHIRLFDSFLRRVIIDLIVIGFCLNWGTMRKIFSSRS